MSINYSFKHHFNYPLPHPSGPIPTAPIAPIPYTHYGYGPRMFRPRFGLFRRFFWFGLGVGAASWYINKKQRAHQRLIEQGDIDADDKRQHGWGWREWGHHRAYHPTATPVAITAPPAAIPTHSSPASTPNGGPAKSSVSNDDIAALRSTLDRMVADKAREMGDIQARAKVDAREFARDKLDKLSVLLEGLKESLNKDVSAEGKGKKLV